MIGLININDLKHLMIFLLLVTHECTALNIDVFIKKVDVFLLLRVFLSNLFIICTES